MRKIVLITGTSSGIGSLATETLARAGHVVYAAMRNAGTQNAEAAGALEQRATDEKLAIHVVDMDVTSDDSVNEAVNRVIAEAGAIDAVVNNAGIMSIGLAEGFTEEQAWRQMDINFMGPFRVSRAVLPHMRLRGSGLLIHVTSIVGRVLFPGCALYCASKFAQEAFAETLHYELAGTGVESIIVQPGPYPTHLLANSPGPDEPERLTGYGPLANLRDRFIGQFSEFFASDTAPQPQEVADAIARLIDLPAGERPLRTVCGLDYGCIKINEQTTPVQADVLRGLGMDSMVARATSA